jgi:hypothetical protein
VSNGSQVDRVREEIRRMEQGFYRNDAEKWCERARDWVPRLMRASAAKRAPKRDDREPIEILLHDERILRAVLLYHPAKSNVEIGNHVGCDGGRVSECMRAARAAGRTFEDGLAYLIETVRPCVLKGDRGPYRLWQRAKKT